MGRSSEMRASICDGSGVWDQNGTHRGRPDGRAEVCRIGFNTLHRSAYGICRWDARRDRSRRRRRRKNTRCGLTWYI